MTSATKQPVIILGCIARSERGWFNNSLQQLELKKQHPEYQMILHSDQGSVYASKAFNDLLPMYVNRSMSRAGTPTDNAEGDLPLASNRKESLQ